MSLSNKEYMILENNSAIEPFYKILFKAALQEDINQFTQEELQKLGELASNALLNYANEPIVIFDKKHIKKLKKEVTVLTIINSNKQFLFDSVQQAINKHQPILYLLAHPILDVAQPDKTKILVALKPTATIENIKTSRLSVMQFVMSSLDKETCLNLADTIKLSLHDIEKASSANKVIIEKILSMQQLWQHSTNTEQTIVIEFLNWLAQEHFIFLTLEQYCFNNQQINMCEQYGIKLAAEQNLCSIPAETVTIAKANQRSRVHQFTWLDEIIILSPNKKHCLRLLGLFTDKAYNNSVFFVPYIKDKVADVVKHLGYNYSDHSGKKLINILERYPRDELFWLTSKELAENVGKLLTIEEKPSLRVITHIEANSPLVTLLVYLPRTQYNINNCENIGKYLLNVFEGDFYEYATFFVNSSLTRVYYIIHRTEKKFTAIDEQQLSEDISSLIRTWRESLILSAQQHNFSNESVKLATNFSHTYRDNLSPEEALDDADHILSLDSNKSLFVKFCKTPNIDDAEYVTLKLYHRESALMLSERVPLLENMGFLIIDEQTFELIDENKQLVYMHSMCLRNANRKKVDLSDDGNLLSTTFEQIWDEKVDDDAYNKLCQSAKLKPREVMILRVYGRYMQQIGTPYSQEHIATALDNYSDIAQDLYNIFYQKFAPDLDKAESESKIAEFIKSIEKKLQNVPSLDDDLILRRYVNLLKSSLRTNAFALDEQGELTDIIAVKFDPKKIIDMPEPKPYREIFVYGMLVEGVHLRFGPVARGGIRWSDRALDYRTEILGLVKAQQVKNVVIVPVGSKGGFYPHQLPDATDRSEIVEAARQAYIGYINAMLSITDNLVDRNIVPPKNVNRIDGDDPYFVVAADKGTATFSDTANAISAKHNFWLDDAFASGGSDGYDHKKMAITARGAWETVKRHFRELFNRDIQNEEFTAAGVGDMSGDVFGNGMLLSKHTKLIAAFDHRDIFIDPDPDTEISYKERKRLFNMDRSSWQDYDCSKLSVGGGIYSRNLKEINLSPQASKILDLPQQKATPFEVIQAILKVDVDLFWFGGIGTYVRATNETNLEVGDRNNDKIRITGKELRAKIIGEGANLGLTQRGRIEYSMANGFCNTDAIDNSAGVNCSDVEVNIKIALADAVENNMLTREERNELLKAMTDDVAQLVLRNNYLQSLIISLSACRASKELAQQKIFIEHLEQKGLLDRKVEILPENSELTQRILHGQGLTRPELSVIIAYAKLVLQKEITKAEFIKNDYFKTRLINYFPNLMQKKYKEVIERHQLREPIIATLISNSLVNSTGSTFAFALAEKLNIDIIEIVKAYIYIYDGFNIEQLINNIGALDNQISGELQNDLYSEVMQYLSQAIESFVTASSNYPKLMQEFSIEEIIYKIAQTHNELSCIKQNESDIYKIKKDKYINLGINTNLADQLVSLQCSVRLLNILPVAVQKNIDISLLNKIYFDLNVMFKANQIEEASQTIPTIDYYDNLAVSMACNNISQTLSKLSVEIVQKYTDNEQPVDKWLQTNQKQIESIRQRINGLVEGDLNISRFVVAASIIQELLKL